VVASLATGGSQSARGNFVSPKHFLLPGIPHKISADSNFQNTQRSSKTKKKGSGAHTEFWTCLPQDIDSLSNVATID
jgi:hypothetical protein